MAKSNNIKVNCVVYFSIKIKESSGTKTEQKLQVTRFRNSAITVDLFYTADSSSDYATSNGRITNE
jgi:hypothetical protein